MNEKRAVLAIPFVLLIFISLFAVLSRHASYKIGGNAFDAQAGLYVPAVFFIAGLWANRFIIRSTYSRAVKLLLIVLTLLAVTLAGYALYEVIFTR